jgi:acyl carrier protein
MKKNKVDIVNKLSELFSTTSSSNQSIDIDTFSSSDLVTDLGYDSLDLINFFFQIEEEFGVIITEEEIESCGLSKIENLAKIIEVKLS